LSATGTPGKRQCLYRGTLQFPRFPIAHWQQVSHFALIAIRVVPVRSKLRFSRGINWLKLTRAQNFISTTMQAS
jgi:hypothetical protein